MIRPNYSVFSRKDRKFIEIYFDNIDSFRVWMCHELPNGEYIVHKILKDGHLKDLAVVGIKKEHYYFWNPIGKRGLGYISPNTGKVRMRAW